jgi:hypothetical protein
MNEACNEPTLGILVSYSKRLEPETASSFQLGMSTVISNVESQLRTEHPSVSLEPIFTVVGLRDSAQTNSADRFVLAVLDITDYDEDQAHLLGVMQGSGTPTVFVCQSEKVSERRSVSDSTLIAYDSLDELFCENSLLDRQVAQRLSQSRMLSQLVYEIWFPRDTNTIWVVCPKIHEPGEFADRSSPDYNYLDNLGDTDALLEVMVFLSRYYPSAIIERFSAEDLPSGHTNNNLVVIGGPGSCEEISNQVCQEMMGLMNSRVSYSDDCEKMIVASTNDSTVELMADFHSDGAIRRDYGYFGRFQNPLNEGAAVVLINGIHTAGVLGAARAFGDRRESLHNYDLVFSFGASFQSFESYFEVSVLNGSVRIPSIQPENVFALGRQRRVEVREPHDLQTTIVETRERSSATILFVGGDRGGGQYNQLQTPKEFESIKDAIRGSEHREDFNIASPIFAVTLEKLIASYRDRPTIIHFAGHGNNRSLSVIVDQGLLATETPVSADQLSTILKNFPQRVRLCVLTTCDSALIAQQLVTSDILDAAIGWPATLDDAEAITFAGLLYGRLGDGLSLGQAVDLAKQACRSHEHPVLFSRPGTDVNAFSVIGTV